jgi:hypothetical protein
MIKSLGQRIVAIVVALALVGLGAFLQSVRAQNAQPVWKVRHLALVVKDAEKSGRAFAEAFGVSFPGVRVIPNSSVVFPDDCQCDRAATIKNASIKVGDGFQFDIVEPVGGASTWRDVLDKRGDFAIHHVSVVVPDVKDTIGQLQKRNGRVMLTDPKGGGEYAYVYMPQVGFNIELAR